MALSLNPSSGGLSPNTTAQLTVTNTGTTTDTFNLTTSGPAAAIIALPQASVTLNAGATQTLTLTIGNPSFAVQGNVAFSINAQSASNPSSSGNVSSSVYPAFVPGVTAAFQPAMQRVPASGTAVFPLIVTNTGSFSDIYTAQIMGTTGQVTAALTNIDGTSNLNNAFYIPAQSSAQLILNLTPTGTQGGTATVSVFSQGTFGTNSVGTATLGAAVGPNTLPPVPLSANRGHAATAAQPSPQCFSQYRSQHTGASQLTFAWTRQL